MAYGAPEQSGCIVEGAPDWVTPALIAHTLRVWQPHYAEPLTEADALAIVCNVVGLLDVLEDMP